MKFFMLLCTALFCVSPASATDGSKPVKETSQLAFYSAFWPNLHHTLYVVAWANRPGNSSRPLAAPLAEPLEGSLTQDERADW